MYPSLCKQSPLDLCLGSHSPGERPLDWLLRDTAANRRCDLDHDLPSLSFCPLMWQREAMGGLHKGVSEQVGSRRGMASGGWDRGAPLESQTVGAGPHCTC